MDEGQNLHISDGSGLQFCGWSPKIKKRAPSIEKMSISKQDESNSHSSRYLTTNELRQVARMHVAILGFYTIDGLFLTLFGWTNVVSIGLGWQFTAMGVAFSLVQIAIFLRGPKTQSSLATNNICMTLGSCLIMLGTALGSPMVGGLMLMSMMTVLAAAALQLERRQLTIAFVACAAGAASVIVGADLPLQWPMATLLQRAATATWFAWLLGKCAAINVAGTTLRQLVREANTQLAAALSEVEKAASTDDLTVLPNRRSIMSKLNRSIEASQGQLGCVGVALFDIDHFKSVNDSFGHAVGDEVLRVFGTLVSESLRPEEGVGRYGGEEFLLVLRQMRDGASACEATERMRKAIESHDWGTVTDGLKVTASAGVALVGPAEASHAAIQRADAALYRAKAGGRNRVILA